MFNIEKNIRSVLSRLATKGVELTPESLANEADMAKVTIYRIFNRDDAKLSQLASLAKVLGVSIYETFEVEGEPKPNTLGEQASLEDKISDNEKEFLLTQIAQLQDNNNVLKKYVASLERELARDQKDSGDSDTGSSKQIG